MTTDVTSPRPVKEFLTIDSENKSGAMLGLGLANIRVPDYKTRMQTLDQFIPSRLRDLDVEEAPLRERLEAISKERDRLRRAAAAAGIKLPDGPAEISAAIEIRARARRRTIPERTIKDAVIEVLRAKGGGMTALEILAAINLKFGTDYPRTSLSPQLSRLKADRKIDREGIVWRLVAKQIDFVQTDLEDTLK